MACAACGSCVPGTGWGLAGVLGATYYGTIDPVRGTAMLIFAFIVVVIGGLGSIGGSAARYLARCV